MDNDSDRSGGDRVQHDLVGDWFIVHNFPLNIEDYTPIFNGKIVFRDVSEMIYRTNYVLSQK